MRYEYCAQQTDKNEVSPNIVFWNCTRESTQVAWMLRQNSRNSGLNALYFEDTNSALYSQYVMSFSSILWSRFPSGNGPFHLIEVGL
jgi:hypothetical protein